MEVSLGGWCVSRAGEEGRAVEIGRPSPWMSRTTSLDR